jgi:hypothetical protein
VRRKIAPKLPPASPGIFKPEPILEEAQHQHILSVIEGMVNVVELSPRTFHDIDEEALRTHFLVQLNGHYEGGATGETFNYEGKTDVLIRSEGRNIFIAECKFWGWPAKFIETIDQLLGYLSWRDSKAAILLFNRNKDFSKVVDAIPGIVKSHPNFQKEEGKRGGTSFRYTFRHRDDLAKTLHVTVMAFDVPRPLNHA